VPLTRASSRGVPVSASAALPEGGSAEGALGALGACATRSAERTGAIRSRGARGDDSGEKPAAIGLRARILRDMVSSSSSVSPAGILIQACYACVPWRSSSSSSG